MGGLSKKIALIQTLRAKEENTLVLEGGNCFLSPSIRVKQDISTRLPGFNVIAEDYLHEQAVLYGIGAGDLAPGIEYLGKLSAAHPFTALSANIVDNTGRLLFAPAVVTQFGKLKIGILAITDHALIIHEDIEALPWEQPLRRELDRLNEQVDFIILLSNYAYKENVRIAEQFKNIRIILQSGYQAANLAPQQINNTLICQTEKQGKYLGVLKLSLEGNGFWEKKRTAEYKEMERETTRITKALSRYTDTRQLTEQEQFKQEKLQAMLEELENKKGLSLGDTAGTTGKGDLYISRFMPLHDSLPENEAVARRVKEALEKRQALLQ